MIPSGKDLLKHGYYGFSGWFDVFEFLLPNGLVRKEILRQFPRYYGLEYEAHQGAWPITPNTEKQNSSVSLDDFVGRKTERK